MKIATWNIGRLKHFSKLFEIQSEIQKVNADILVLTETDQRIDQPFYKYRFETPNLIEVSKDYKTTENRVSIFTNFEIINFTEEERIYYEWGMKYVE